MQTTDDLIHENMAMLKAVTRQVLQNSKELGSGFVKIMRVSEHFVWFSFFLNGISIFMGYFMPVV